MSIDATRFVWKLSKSLISSSQKLFLLSVADRCGENNECYPSLARLEADTGLNRKTLIECRKYCIEIGILSYTGKFAPKKSRTDEKDKPQEYTQVPVMRLNCNNLREFEAPIDKISTRIKNGTSTENGTGTSTENGTGTSTKNGTLNLSVEPIKEPVCDKAYSPLFNTHDASNCKTAKKEALADKDCLALFKKKFDDYDVNYEKLYDLAQEKCGRPSRPVGKSGFYNFINTQKNSFYAKKSKISANTDVFLPEFTDRERLLLQDYKHSMKYPGVLVLSKTDIEEAKKLIQRLKRLQPAFPGENLIKTVSQHGL